MSLTHQEIIIKLKTLPLGFLQNGLHQSKYTLQKHTHPCEAC